MNLPGRRLGLRGRILIKHHNNDTGESVLHRIDDSHHPSVELIESSLPFQPGEYKHPGELRGSVERCSGDRRSWERCRLVDLLRIVWIWAGV
jgi:hypothetical protein